MALPKFGFGFPQSRVNIFSFQFFQIFAKHSDIPEAQGLFNPENDKDACGVGFIADLSKEPTRKTVSDALEMLVRMTHRGACGCETNTGEELQYLAVMMVHAVVAWQLTR